MARCVLRRSATCAREQGKAAFWSVWEWWHWGVPVCAACRDAVLEKDTEHIARLGPPIFKPLPEAERILI